MTKSDVIGIVSGILIDWTHKGVINLIKMFESKGYIVIYLTCRSYEMV